MGLNVIVGDLRKCDNLISDVIASDHRERGNLNLFLSGCYAPEGLQMTSEGSYLFLTMTMVIGNALYFISSLWDNAKRKRDSGVTS